MNIIRVPASTANLGCGFDALGGALSLYLVIQYQSHSEFQLSYTGDSSDSVPLTLNENLITAVASCIASIYSKTLPPLQIHIHNDIPLGRGLGSSGSAVIGGILLANQACNLQLSSSQILDYAVFIEGHPDNVSASLLGGITASYCNRSIDKEHSYFEKFPFGQSQDAPKLQENERITTCLKVPMSSRIKAVVVIPRFTLSTCLARSVLPPSYSRADVVYNLQRIAVLTTALIDPLDPFIISQAMSDRIHQPYRQHLIPGLQNVLEWNVQDHAGLLGVSLSGAGPTVIALATDHFEEIGNAILQELQSAYTSSSVDVNVSMKDYKDGLIADVKILDFVALGSTLI